MDHFVWLGRHDVSFLASRWEKALIACLHDYQSYLKTFLKALIGWNKAGVPKEPLLF